MSEYQSAAEAYKEGLESIDVELRHDKKFLEVVDSKLRWNMHYGQARAMASTKRFIVCIASRQSGKCVREGALVKCVNKYIPIEDISIGDDIYHPFLPCKVINKIHSGKKPCYKVTANNSSLSSTMDHKFWTPCGFRTLKQVVDESLSVMVGNRFYNPSVKYEGEYDTYDIEVSESHAFFAKHEGDAPFFVHNSEIGPPWLYEEMRARGPGNYMVVAPSFPILEASALPKFRRLFVDLLKLGKIKSKPLTFTLSEEGERHLWGHKQSILNPTIVSFGHGANPASLEARTSMACWIDEGGQSSFKGESFEAIEGRHVTTQGRILITTTPYDFGTLKTRYYDPWIESEKSHKDIDVIQWPSTANPNFPPEEFERLRGTMPEWRFKMFYCGEYTMPSGLIYDIVANGGVLVPAFDIPSNWPIYAGVDFGGMNTMASYAALDPHNMIAYLYREYYPYQQLPISIHTKNMLRTAGGIVEACFGGARSEGQWRDEFRRSGLFIQEPDISDVEVGIARVYNLMAQGRLKIMTGTDATKETTEQIYNYRYESDPETGEVLPERKIVDKSSFHAMDAMRYMGTGLKFLLSGVPQNAAIGGGRNYEEMDPLTITTDTLTMQRTVVVVGGGNKQYSPYQRDVTKGQLMRPWWDKLT